MAITRTVKIPEGVTLTLEGSNLSVKGPKGTLSRDLHFPGIRMEVKGRELTITSESERKKLLAMVGTYAAHVRNMCRGVTEGYQYRMKVVYSHFPIQLKMAGSTLEVHNFLGEKTTRYARVEPGVKVALGSDEVTLTGIDRETVGKTAANIEHATKIRDRDPRVFQDGVYIVERV